MNKGLVETKPMQKMYAYLFCALIQQALWLTNHVHLHALAVFNIVISLQ
jgi:hypothetical protein